MKRQLVENKERQSKQQQQQQWQDNQSSDKNDKPYVIIAGDSLTKGLKGWLMSRKKKVKCCGHTAIFLLHELSKTSK